MVDLEDLVLLLSDNARLDLCSLQLRALRSLTFRSNYGEIIRVHDFLAQHSSLEVLDITLSPSTHEFAKQDLPSLACLRMQSFRNLLRFRELLCPPASRSAHLRHLQIREVGTMELTLESLGFLGSHLRCLELDLIRTAGLTQDGIAQICKQFPQLSELRLLLCSDTSRHAAIEEFFLVSGI